MLDTNNIVSSVPTSSIGLKGEKGAPGAQGTTGSPGSPGAQGATGGKGEPGAQGTTGSPGAQGATGGKGEPGAQGTTGTGTQGTTGAQGPSGTGIAWLESNATDLTVWNNGKGNDAGTTVFGENVLNENISGVINTAFGYNCLTYNTYGNYNAAFGNNALLNITTGSRNTGLGTAALSNANIHVDNVGVGYYAGEFVSGSGNVYIGPNAGPTSSIAENSKLYIASGSGTPLIGGDFSASIVTITGELRATGDVIAYYSSDERLKDNITPISNALDKVKQIGGYEFDWNDKQSTYEGHDVGVIAQEIEAVLPELVTTRDNGYKAVKYEKIIALLIEAIKEQQRQIDELKSM
jgi:hypothetical protein